MASLLKASNAMLLINQQYNFANPNTGVTTKHVEVMWQRVKAKLKSMCSPTNRAMTPDYLAEIMWNQRFKEHSYFRFWTQVTQLHLYELHGKNMTFFKCIDLSKKTVFLKATIN